MGPADCQALGSRNVLLGAALLQGARVHKLLVAHDSPRTFRVSEPVSSGETLISLPQQLLLHCGVAFSDRQWGPAFRALRLEYGEEVLDNRSVLCLLLVLEKARQAQSRWAPYICILPTSFDDPYWWQEEQRRLLRGTRLGRAVQQYRKGLHQLVVWAKRLDELHRTLSGGQDQANQSLLSSYAHGWALTEGAARWARSAVWSRSFTVRRMADGSTGVVAMVPILDMIDHSPSMEVVWHTGPQGDQDFQFAPLCDVPQGAIITNNYGCKSSDELLLAYGFLLDGHNPADYFQVSLAHSRQPPTLTGGPPAVGPSLRVPAQGQAQGQAHPAAGAATGQGPGVDPGAQQQGAAEDTQRALALAGHGLSLDHHLTLTHPLPASLVHGAQLCLATPSQLYLITAVLLQRQQQEQYAARSAAAAAAGPGQATGPVADGGTLHPPPPGAGGSVCGQKRGLSEVLSSSSAMHIQPTSTRPGGGGQQQQQGVPADWMQMPHVLSHAGGHMQPHVRQLVWQLEDLHHQQWLAQQQQQGCPQLHVHQPLVSKAEDSHEVPQQGIRLSEGQLQHSQSFRQASTSPPPASSQLPPPQGDQQSGGLLSQLAGDMQYGLGLTQQLQALVSLHKQLHSKLDNMLPDAEHQQLLNTISLAPAPQPKNTLQQRQQMGSSSSSTLKWHNAGTRAGASGQGPAGAAAGAQLQAQAASVAAAVQPPQPLAGSPLHTHLALTYVAGQKHIIQGTLAAVQSRASAHVHAAAHTVTTALGQSGECELRPLIPAPASAASTDNNSTGAQGSTSSSSTATTAQGLSSPSSGYDPMMLVGDAQGPGRPAEPGGGGGGGGDADGQGARLLGAQAPPLPVCCIDPDTHLRHYQDWLQHHSLAPPQSQIPQGAATRRQRGDHHPTTSSALHQAGNVPTDQLDSERQHRHHHSQSHQQPHDSNSDSNSSDPSPALQEVLVRRTLRLQPPAQGTASADASNGNGSSSSNKPRARAPPSGSRTFRMMAKPHEQQPMVLTGQPAANEGGSTTTPSGSDHNVIRSSGPSLPTSTSPAPLVRVTLPQGMAASLGLDSKHDPLALGASLVRDVGASQVVMRVPEEVCFMAPSRQGLVRALMASAYALLQSLLPAVWPHAAASSLGRGPAGLGLLGGAPAASSAAAGIAAAQAAPSMQRDMLTWHLMHSVAASPAARLTLSDTEGVQLLADMLEDSPAGIAYQESLESLKADFTQLRTSLCGVKLSTSNGGSSGNGKVQGQNGMAQADALCRVLSRPTSYNLYCWAHSVVERCATTVSADVAVLRHSQARGVGALRDSQPSTGGGSGPAAAAAGAASGSAATEPLSPRTRLARELSTPVSPRAGATSSSGGHQQQQQQQQQAIQLWVLAPILAAVPSQLRSACLSVELAPAQAPAAAAAAGPGVPAGGLVVEVRAVCRLSRGLLLSPLVLLPGLDCEDAMTSYGPEALSWAHLLRKHVPQPPSTHPEPVPAPPAANATEAPAAAAGAPPMGPQAATREVEGVRRTSSSSPGYNHHHHPLVLYELYICPSEEDKLCDRKLALLTACGLGCIHYLTHDLSTELMVGAALKICLAGGDLLSHPLVGECIAAHAALQAGGPVGEAEEEVMPRSASQPAAAQGELQQQQGDASPQPGGQPQAVGHPKTSSASSSQQQQQQQQQSKDVGAGGAARASSPAHLASLQGSVLRWLAELPDDHPVCKAARKQLRNMVHDARKNSRRRLRQLEAVHAHVSASASAVAAATSGIAFGGLYSPLGGSTAMHEGVRLYLTSVCAVLDAWAEHLGLSHSRGSHSESNKRLKH